MGITDGSGEVLGEIQVCDRGEKQHSSDDDDTDGFNVKVKAIPQKAEVAQGVPGRLGPRIFLTFGTTRVVGRQPYALATFRRNPWYSLSEAESTSGHMVPSGEATKNIPSDPTWNRSRDRPTSSAVP